MPALANQLTKKASGSKTQKNTWAYIQVQLAATDTKKGFSSREENFSKSASNLARKAQQLMPQLFLKLHAF